MVLPESPEKMVAFSDIVISADYRDIAGPGGRIGCRSFDLHTVLMQGQRGI